MKKLLFILTASIYSLIFLNAQSADESFISTEKGKGKLALSVSGKSIPLLISSKDWPGVIRAFKDLQSDIGKVTSVVPELYTDNVPESKELIIAGTIGKSPLIDNLIRDKKIDVNGISGQWETFLIQVINNPMAGVKKALVIAGSDKRGTIYGIYEISKQIGVSPWYWWADVPVLKKNELYANKGRYIQGSPSVKYRGIFLNDEAPDLTNWIREKYGTVTPAENPPMPGGVANYGREFYSKLFELILRLKGNYLWPAMWNNAFNEDDLGNPGLADEYGIVMGNSHQEPMLRAQKEWDRRYQRTIGTWNYAKNPDITKIPQLWCLYKEVQDYYKAGMRVPDDVTLLWAEDNWGNIRRLPTAEERKRSGGAGIYYHFDYHGGPRSYQWLNTSPIAKIWDQMSLAKQYGADRIWIVNVGHFKGYELPMEYFLDLAWNTNKQSNDNIDEYTRQWASEQFGGTYSKEIAGILSGYTKFNGRRKPELLAPSTYSLVNYHEAEHFTKLIDAGTSRWIRIEDYGHTLSAMRTTSDVQAIPATPGKDSPCLEYKMYLFSTGTYDITSIFSPSLNFIAGRGVQYAISFDNQSPQIITLIPENYNAQNRNTDWEKTVSDNVRFSHSSHTINIPGYHILKIFMIDPGVVLQKIIVNSGGLKPSYLGPPESFFKTVKK